MSDPSSAMARSQRRLRISGRVQGVGYRDWLTDSAVALGLDGWVRNRRDGSVEAVVEGPQAAVEKLIAEASRGPRMARVSSIDVAPATEPVAGTGFTRRTTE